MPGPHSQVNAVAGTSPQGLRGNYFHFAGGRISSRSGQGGVGV